MASYSAAQAKHATLTSTTADAISLTGTYVAVEIVNHDASTLLYAKVDRAAPTAPTSGADDTEVIRPGERLRLCLVPRFGDDPLAPFVGVVGNGNAYSVIGVHE